LVGVVGVEGGAQQHAPGLGEGRVGVDGGGELQAVHPGHVPVDEGQRDRAPARRGGAQRGQGFRGAGGAVHLCAQAAS
jgi:hypothetical protein